ncbi:MAG: hypothetical protein AAGF12_40045, partial [Myxococcota bacterium]
SSPGCPRLDPPGGDRRHRAPQLGFAPPFEANIVAALGFAFGGPLDKGPPVGLLDRFRRRKDTDPGVRASRIRRHAEAEGDEAAFDELQDVFLRHGFKPELCRLAAELLRAQGRGRAADLFARVADTPHDVRALFELGSHLLSTEAPHLAIAALESALTSAPFDGVIRSELAIAQARAGRPADAAKTLALHPRLAVDPGALFQFAWASLLSGDVGAAERAGGELQLHRRDALTQKLEVALARAAKFPLTREADARDFLFVEHASLLVQTGREAGGRYGVLRLDRDDIATLASSLGWVLRKLRPLAARVHTLPEGSAFAAVVARALGVDVEPFDGTRTQSSIVIVDEARHLEEIDQRFFSDVNLLTVALSMNWSESHRRVPHVVGVLSRTVEHGDDCFDLDGVELNDDEASEALRRFVDARHTLFAPGGDHVASAYVPDAPLPWP